MSHRDTTCFGNELILFDFLCECYVPAGLIFPSFRSASPPLPYNISCWQERILLKNRYIFLVWKLCVIHGILPELSICCRARTISPDVLFAKESIKKFCTILTIKCRIIMCITHVADTFLYTELKASSSENGKSLLELLLDCKEITMFRYSEIF